MRYLDKYVGKRLVVTNRRYNKYLEYVPECTIIVTGQVSSKSESTDTLTCKQVNIAKEFGVVGIGGGTILDYAKFVASICNAKDLLLIPGTITTDAPWTNSYGIRDFENQKIEYAKTTVLYNTIYDIEFLQSVRDTELIPAIDQYAICELFCHFTASWEAINIHKKKKPNNELEFLATHLRYFPQQGSTKWYELLQQLFEWSIIVQNTYGVEFQEGSEHYIAYYLELVEGYNGYPHGALLCEGIDFILKYQKPELEGVKIHELWDQLKTKYNIKGIRDYDMSISETKLKKFLKENEFGDCLLEEITHEKD